MGFFDKIGSSSDGPRRKNSNSNSNNNNAPPPRLFCLRFTLVLLVIFVSLISIYFSYSLTSLYSQVESDTTKIKSLQNQIYDQKSIIDRFNNSITNADVEHHVQLLEESLTHTQQEMKEKLETTTRDIQNLLSNTVNNLNGTIE
jgi:predicted PurR-regulated permease PerM